MCSVPLNDWRELPLTCEVAQAQLPQAVVPVPPVVEEDGQRVAPLVQLGSPDDPQVLQRQVVELVESHQHVAGHFSDRLRDKKTEEWILNMSLRLRFLLLRPVNMINNGKNVRK